MKDQRFIIEMGMGNDLHGMDYQKAAKRAIEDAFRHSTLPIFGATGIDPSTMRVQVTVGVQDPAALDTEALAATLPRGRATVHAVKGGQNVTNPDDGETLVIATAAIEAFLPYKGDHWHVAKPH
ncbi:Lin0512 family protein [Roseovarius sp. 2305UL8-3]|uniref:Lin0512 family protein n=1 Tax=Roseovarius conchicola TaxID=3121636 RepID=UPI003527D572